jgi:hypothetical protein
MESRVGRRNQKKFKQMILSVMELTSYGESCMLCFLRINNHLF